MHSGSLPAIFLPPRRIIFYPVGPPYAPIFAFISMYPAHQWPILTFSFGAIDYTSLPCLRYNWPVRSAAPSPLTRWCLNSHVDVLWPPILDMPFISSLLVIHNHPIYLRLSSTRCSACIHDISRHLIIRQHRFMIICALQLCREDVLSGRTCIWYVRA